MSVPAGPQDSSACDRASRRRVTDLVAACRRHGVAMGLLTCGNRRAMEAVARRAQLPMLSPITVGRRLLSERGLR
jgi:hypothetical protein